MQNLIRPNRPEVSDRFPMLGFTIRTSGENKRYEVAVASDVALFHPDAKLKRANANFYSSRAAGLQPIATGEAVYVLPPEVLARFVGQEKLYYALVTYSSGNGAAPDVVTVPSEGSAYVSLRGLTGRSLQRVRVLPNRQREATRYGNGSGSELEWGGDVTMPETRPVIGTTAAPTNGRSNYGTSANPTESLSPSSPAPAIDYKDGFGAMPPTPVGDSPPRTDPVIPQASSLELVTPAYTPTNAQDALRMQLEFQTRYEQWLAGVADTSFFPHSAICKIVADNGSFGTGCYIGPYHLLTAAHVVEGANSFTIIPGKNGGADLNGPFGSFNVTAANCSVHPQRQAGNRNFDLAVIAVSTPPPGGQYFEILEELRQSLPSSIIVCGYSAQSDTNAAVTAAIDPELQHLDGDQIRSVADQTFQYNLQTLHGASGAPVYYAWGREDEQQQMSVVELRIVGVHVAPFSGTLNESCRLTDDKITWIRSVMSSGAAAGMALGERTRRVSSRAQANECYSINWDEVELIAQPTNLSCWATSGAMVIGWRDRMSLTPETIARIAGQTIVSGLDSAQFQQFANDLGLVPENPQCYTIEGFRQLLERAGPLWVGAALPGRHIVVVTGMYSDGAADGSDTYVRITDPWDRIVGAPGSPVGNLPTHNTGSRYIMSWADFLTAYEGAGMYPDVVLQILHSGGTNGREPRRSGAAGYAMAFSTEDSSATGQGDGGGIDEGIPISDEEAASAQGYTRALDNSPDYPQTSRFAPAAPVNYRTSRSQRTINRVVIHITDGGTRINGTIGWFQNPNQLNRRGEPIHVSAHYVVGQDGEVVQMVPNNDVAWHANSANGDSIGIEHVANTRGLMPSDAQYCASAALARWLCDTYNLPLDRVHVLGHSEADTRTTHSDCPNAVWDWDHYMDLVQTASCRARGQAVGQALGVSYGASQRQLPPPPPPIVGARAMDAGTVQIPSIISGALMERVVGQEGNISWQLDQLRGLKHPSDTAPPSPLPLRDASTIRLDTWPYLDTKPLGHGNIISAAFTVDWQFNGKSVGNVRIVNGRTSGAQLSGLRVQAAITDDPVVYPQDNPTYAALRIIFTYLFRAPDGSDFVAKTNLHLLGDGTFEKTSVWERI